MAEKLPDSPENSSQKIVVKGKYLTAIEKYVSSLVLGEDLPVKWNDEFKDLQETIVQRHGSFLSRNNAVSIILKECFLFENQHPGRAGPLSDPSNSDLQASLVDSIKNYLESLPRNYTLRIGLPSFPTWDAAKYDISKEVRIVIDGSQVHSKNALAGGLAQMHAQNALVRSLMKGGAAPVGSTMYVEFSTNGYSDWSPDSLAVSVCLSLAKQFAFILTSHGICNTNYTQDKASATLTDNYESSIREIALPDSIARCFGQLIPNEEKLLIYDVLLSDERPAVSSREKATAFKNSLDAAVRFYKAKDHPDFESIATAIEWYQDSLFADNQTFSYVAVCIGLEALFGSDGHLDNMSKRLADRYAFLLGKSRSEREKMIAEYTKVLNLRGRLVHSKAARLNGDDLELLTLAQKMLLHAIWHELQAMYKAKDEQQRA